MEEEKENKMVKKNVALLAIVMCIVMFAMTACGGSGGSGGGDGETASDSSSSDSAQSGDSGSRTLRVGTTEDGGSFNPWVGTATCASYLVFETVQMRQGDGSTIPWLAESLSWPDPTTLEIKLRDDVYFNDGDQLQGEDIIYTFQQMVQDPSSPMASHFMVIDYDASTVSDDGLTITFKFNTEYGPFENYIDLAYVVNKSACEDWAPDDERWWDAPITTAPYSIVENVSGSHVTLKLREDYWNKENMPDWDEVIVNFYSDQTAMFVAFENNEIDLVLDVAANDEKRLESGDVSDPDNTKYEVISSKAELLLGLSPNRKEFADPKVREAIANVIDREAVGEAAYGGLYELGDSVIAPETKYHVTTGLYEGGVEYAKQCMAESDYPDGFDINVLVLSSENAMWEVLQSSLAEIGINATVNATDMATAIPMWMQPDGTDIFSISVAGGNVLNEPYADLASFWKNGPYPSNQILDDDYNAIFERFVYTNDDATREAACAELQQWLHDNFQAIPVIIPSYTFAYKSNVISSCDFFSATRANLVFCKAA
jgi:peptide/nickel transport system substrate-binding protein